MSEKQCLSIARGKTGALFAFVGTALAGGDLGLRTALEESGYRVGTAYQLADDLLDFSGREEVVGKTLGTDAARGKATLPSLYRVRPKQRGSQDAVGELVWQRIDELLCMVPRLLDAWPRVRTAVTDFIEADLLGALRKCPELMLGRRHSTSQLFEPVEVSSATSHPVEDEG